MENTLPKNWVETDLDTVVLRMTNGSNLTQHEEEFEGSFPISRIETIWNETIDLDRVKYVEADENNIEKYGLQKGDVLFSHINSDKHLGKTAVFNLDKTVIHGINLLLLRAMPQFNGDLLNYILRHYRFSGKFIEVAQRSVNQSSINQKKLKSFIVPLPPLAEQQRIVAKLDVLINHLDTLKTRLNHIPQLLKNFRQAVLTQAVTGKLTEEWRVGKELEDVDLYLKLITEDLDKAYNLKCEEAKKNGARKPKDQRKNKRSDKGDINLNKIPDNWRYERAENVSYLITDGVHFKPTYVKNVRPFKTLEDSCKFIPKEDHIQYIKRCNPENGDILYTKVGATYGYASKVDLDFEFSIYVSLALIKPSKLLNSDYLELLFNSPLIFNQARHRVSGSGVPDLHLIEIRDFKLPIPPKQEQTEIVKQVEGLFAKADNIETQYKNLKTKTDSLPQAILAKTFKGELVEQLDTDGSAMILLEEIKKLKEELKPVKKAVKRKKKVNSGI